MLRNVIRFCLSESAVKWNLLLLYALLIISAIVTRHNLQYPFQVLMPMNVSSYERRNDFHTSNSSIELYDITGPIKADFKCVQTRTTPSTTVCLYSQFQDIYISHDLEFTGRWEPQVLNDFLEVLRRDADVGVFDIGANIGFYTLLAAKMGHHVVAVEPLLDSIHRIHLAAQLEKLCNRITILRNAIADVRALSTIRKSGDNQGDTRIELGVKPCQGTCPSTVKTILLDDLIEVLPFERAVMKVDIQGFEHKGFQHAALLFSRVTVTYVFMEWLVMKEHYARTGDKPSERFLLEEMLSFFLHRNYRPYRLSSDGGSPLDPNLWHLWPDDIVWHLLPDAGIKTRLLQRHFHQWPL